MDYIELAIEEAKKAYSFNEVPVGALIVKDNQIISKNYNRKIIDNDVTSHAEILAIREAEKNILNWHLDDCSMYVTLEPCPMCAGAIKESRISKLYIGTKSNNPQNELLLREILGNSIDIVYLDNKDCSNLLTKFFQELRK